MDNHSSFHNVHSHTSFPHTNFLFLCFQFSASSQITDCLKISNKLWCFLFHSWWEFFLSFFFSCFRKCCSLQMQTIQQPQNSKTMHGKKKKSHFSWQQRIWLKWRMSVYQVRRAVPSSRQMISIFVFCLRFLNTWSIWITCGEIVSFVRCKKSVVLIASGFRCCTSICLFLSSSEMFFVLLQLR